MVIEVVDPQNNQLLAREKFSIVKKKLACLYKHHSDSLIL